MILPDKIKGTLDVMISDYAKSTDKNDKLNHSTNYIKLINILRERGFTITGNYERMYKQYKVNLDRDNG